MELNKLIRLTTLLSLEIIEFNAYNMELGLPWSLCRDTKDNDVVELVFKDFEWVYID